MRAMENTIVEDPGTVTEKIVRMPGQVETVLVEGEKGLVKAGSLVADATRTGASDLVESGKQLGRDLRQAVDPAPTPG